MNILLETERESIQAPEVSFSFSLEPLRYSVSAPELPKFSASITSHAPYPITVFTSGTVLKPHRPFRGKNYSILDLTTDQHVNLEDDMIQRTALRMQMGQNDEKYFVTLFPEIPVEIIHPFSLAGDWKNRDPNESLTKIPWKGSRFPRVITRKFLEPGHRYRFGLADRVTIAWWKVGTKEEVLVPADAAPDVDTHMEIITWPPIILSGAPDVEIEICE